MLTSAATAGVVGTGTPVSCTQAALLTQIAAGGTVTFNCGGAVQIPVDGLFIPSTNPATVIDGGGNITLDGTAASSPMVFITGSAASLPDVTFRNMTFANGHGTLAAYVGGGAIHTQGKLTLDTVTFDLNITSTGGGGAVKQEACTGCLLPSTTIRYCSFTANRASGWGGAIQATDGSMAINDTDFDSNSATDGGAIALTGGFGATRSLSVSNGHFSHHQATAGNGGAILGVTAATGTISIDSSTFSGNSAIGAGHSGGAVYTQVTDLTVVGSLFTYNSSEGDSGAVKASGANLAFRDTTFSHNGSSSGGAGALGVNGATATIQRCTFDTNSAGAGGPGGALVVSYAVGIENSTFSGNSSLGTSGYAGAIYLAPASQASDFRNVTITGNSANAQGGVVVAGDPTALTIRNSILAGNTATGGGGGNSEIAVTGGGVFTSAGYNLIGDSTGITVAGTDIVNPNPNLGALANNGGPTFGNVVVVGPTFTRLPNQLPAPASPAIDAGNPAGCLALGGGALTTDQRGLSRPSGGRCDIGAVEVQAPAGPVIKVAFVQQPTNAVAGASITPSVTVQLQDAGGTSVTTAGVSITLALASGTGTLSGTATQLTDASGLATFAGLSVNLIGTKTLSATSTGLTGATSSSFVISAGAAASLVIEGGNSQHTLVGTPFGALLMVDVLDSLGNPVSGASVAFTPPGSGASAVVTGSPDTTGADGVASVSVTANGTVGSYNVVASSGTLTPVSFALTNDPAAPETNNVPALGTVGMALFALALSLVGVFVVRRIG